MWSCIQIALRRAGLVAAAMLLLVAGQDHARASAANRASPGVAAIAPDSASFDRITPESAITALRRALAARDRGDASADPLLSGVARRYPIIADHVELKRAEMLYDRGKIAVAAGAALRSLKRYPDSRLRTDFNALLGQARAEYHDEDGARTAWQAALDGTRDDERRARLRLAIAESLERSKQSRDAAVVYRVLWSSHATSPEADVAAKSLDAIEARLETSLRSGNDWRRRGDKLFRKRHNDEALEAYDQALRMGLKENEERRVRKQRAHTLFRLREYPQAVEAFSTLPQRDDVPLWRARSLARSGEVPKAVEEFEALAGRSKNEIGIRASFLAGLLLDGRGKREEAEVLFDRVARNRISASLSQAALWRLGWSAFRGENHDRALEYFDLLLKVDSDDEIGRLRARYWHARAMERLGREGWQDEFTTLAREFPLSYYGWRARTRAVQDGLPADPGKPKPGRDRLTSELVDRPRILLAAGLREEAIEEMRVSSRKARSLNDRLTMAELFSEASEYHRAQRLVVDAYTEDLARGPSARLEELWWYAWPSAFETHVRGSTQSQESVEPELVYAIMREESSFRPQILSASGARGLLQIMIPTGERLARQVGADDYEADDLFEPATNIRLGAHYLWDLSRRFDGNLSAAIASYNAGPDAVKGWLGPESPSEDDEWVEAIPYDQTRSYVKRVLRSYHAYRVLY